MLAASNLIDSLDYIDGNFVPVSSLEGHEVCNEDKEITNSGRNPGSEDWNFFKGGQIEAKEENTSWQNSTLNKDMVWKDAVLDAKTSEESFQHRSNGVKENVEDPKLVNSQDSILKVDIISNWIQSHSHKGLKG